MTRTIDLQQGTETITFMVRTKAGELVPQTRERRISKRYAWLPRTAYNHHDSPAERNAMKARRRGLR